MAWDMEAPELEARGEAREIAAHCSSAYNLAPGPVAQLVVSRALASVRGTLARAKPVRQDAERKPHHGRFRAKLRNLAP